MTASALQNLGWVLTVGGIVFVVASQLILTLWHNKKIENL